MQNCSFCGGELPDQFRFCGFCGSPLEAGATLVKESRKTITVVFCDLKGSTNLGEALDSESLRELMSRYFERMSARYLRYPFGMTKSLSGSCVVSRHSLLPQVGLR